MPSIRLGDLLVKAKVITDQQLKAALSEQQKWGGKLGEILVRMQILTEEMLVKALSKQLNIPAVNLEQVSSIPPHVRAKVPSDVARDLVVLPVQLQDGGKTLVVVMSEPQNLRQLDTLRSVSHCTKIVPQVAGRQAIARAFTRFYEGAPDVQHGPEEGSIKFINAQGSTLIKSTDEVAKSRRDRPAPPPPKSPPRPAPAAPSPGSKSPSDTLRSVEEAQRKEVAALKAMVELLIEKGVFSRDEYLAKVKR